MKDLSSTDFVVKLNSTKVDVKEGIIESLLIINDCVYAIVRKNYDSIRGPDGRVIDRGDGLFNCIDGSYPENYTLPELLIKTNIQAFNTVLQRYIGKKCKVSIREDIPVLAEVSMGETHAVNFDIDVIKQLRERLPYNKGLFDDTTILKEAGLTDTNIEDLRKCVYDSSYKNKLLTIEGEGTWYRDTSKPITNEIVLKNNSIWQGTNQKGMEDTPYHIPTKVFSGK